MGTVLGSAGLGWRGIVSTTRLAWSLRGAFLFVKRDRGGLACMQRARVLSWARVMAMVDWLIWNAAWLLSLPETRFKQHKIGCSGSVDIG